MIVFYYIHLYKVCIRELGVQNINIVVILFFFSFLLYRVCNLEQKTVYLSYLNQTDKLSFF